MKNTLKLSFAVILLVAMLALSLITSFPNAAESHKPSWCPIEVCTLLAGGVRHCYVTGYVFCHEPHSSS